MSFVMLNYVGEVTDSLANRTHFFLLHCFLLFRFCVQIPLRTILLFVVSGQVKYKVGIIEIETSPLLKIVRPEHRLSFRKNVDILATYMPWKIGNTFHEKNGFKKSNKFGCEEVFGSFTEWHIA